VEFPSKSEIPNVFPLLLLLGKLGRGDGVWYVKSSFWRVAAKRMGQLSVLLGLSCMRIRYCRHGPRKSWRFLGAGTEHRPSHSQSARSLTA
jgi:hypothetical protein